MTSKTAPGTSVISFAKEGTVVHKCRVCFKPFKRREHRNRHERSHTHEKPHICRFCGRRYARSDLVTRHEKTLHADQWQPVSRDLTQSSASEGRDEHGLMDDSAAATNEETRTDVAITNVPDNSASTSVIETTTAQVTATDFGSFGIQDVNFDTYNDLSPSFFDPFLGDVFDSFALPTFDQSGIGMNMEDAYLEPSLASGETPVPPQTPKKEHCLPRISRTRATAKPSMIFTEEMRAHCVNDLRSHLTPERLGDFQMPDTACLQKCLNSYVESFHVHFPFLHLPTLSLKTAPSPLTLSICAIGALHRLDRKLAASLYLTAESILSIVEFDTLRNCSALLQDWAKPRDMPTSASAPLPLAQARLLLVFFASFSGEPQLIRQALVGCGFLSAEFRSRMSRMRPVSTATELSDWRTWVEHESTKRLMCSSMILGNLLVITYGMVPGFSILEDADIGIPADDALWEAKTASDWETLTANKPLSSHLGLREATSAIFGQTPLENKSDVCWEWSPFAASVVMHSVAIAIWYLTQGQQVCHSAIRNSKERHDASQIAAALSRCRDLLAGVADAQTGTEGTWNEAESPLLFNAFAILRVSYGRAFIRFHSLDRSLLFKESSQVMLSILRRYFEAVQDRDPFMTMAVSCALEGFAIPIRAGILLMRKTAAFKWSVEHALASWDAGLLVTKWLYAVECSYRTNESVTPEEKQVLDSVRQLLNEVESHRSEQSSLAAELARMWASIYDDTWVWGVAPRIGWVLRELANMYETGIVAV